MPAGTSRNSCQGSAVSATVGLLLTGMVATPAYAESVREREWHLTVMKAEQIWQTSTGKGITVAVIDTGVDDNLADLKGRVLAGQDEAPDSPGDEHTDHDGHGTTMALLIAGTGQGNGGEGTFGLAPGARILPVRMPDRGWDAGRYSREFDRTLSSAIRYAADSGAQVINISMGSSKGSDQLSGAVKYALDKGSLVFAAVGNSGAGGNQVEYPAATPGVVGVGSVGKDLHKTAESEFGPQVDLAAPGDEMYHACPNGKDLCRSHGTSDATAIASASAALIWSKHPTWTNNQVLRVLLNTVGAPTDGAKRNDSIGYGIVRPRVALQSPGNPGPAGAYPLPDLVAVPASAASSSNASDSGAAGASAKEGDLPASASPSGDGGNGVLRAGLAVGSVVMLGAGAVVLAVRRHRRRHA
ncbi:type VII secretion-associated serine protease mycosin [Streptomyces sp. MBT65]|uniref:type VII secretion-associated serine protease mycosin n=1 Tax=Streptomyces sp. MBT65 TaxID=1488395 RepID=UPI00190A548B|nr:type VII secretion-associated serine protease mycosin [Streptomyces sp. MBT65]MBK3575304.1 type VII secretion-associated serine protease mycosin [Streptomyces sp. MBT65]